mmetsp:Transcript_69586/g.163549  ORF Transcript_69586/g.163549 Transcript_69586/m.163549 type:complete len:263 (+) Transcript_69586:2507-3295(+)
MRKTELALQRRFALEGSIEVQLQRLVERAPRLDQGAGRQAGQLLRHRHRGVQQFGVGHHAADQPQPLRVDRLELVAEQGQLQRLGTAHETRQQPGAAAVRHQADLAEGLDEAGAFRRQHEVAAQRQIGTRAGGHTVDRRHHRHRHAAQTQRQRDVVVLQHQPDVLGRSVWRDEWIGQVLAGAEGPARAGDQHRPDLLVCGGGFQRRAQLAEQVGRQRVQCLGAVQAQQKHLALRLDLDQLLGHQIPLPTGRLIVELPLIWIK